MKSLRYKNIQREIIFDRKTIYYLDIENIRFYREFILGIRNQIENEDEYATLYDDEGQLPFGKHVFFVNDPLLMELDEKKLNASIQKDLTTHLCHQSKEEYEILLSQISEYLDKISYDYAVPLTFDDELPISSFLKAFSLRYDKEKGDVLENLLNQTRTISSVFGFSVFIFMNLCDYLTRKELEAFDAEMRSLELDYLILSNHLPYYRLEHEFIIRVDDDLCELHIDSENAKD